MTLAGTRTKTATPIEVFTQTPTGTDTPTFNELITMVNIALGNAALSACPIGDVNTNSTIEINEIITAVNNALSGCG